MHASEDMRFGRRRIAYTMLTRPINDL